jgi:4-amino-4-deoxy-L-arabinose transferase-like glycosyltransferase
LGISVLISVFAAIRGGYVGPDFNMHLAHMVDPARLFDFFMPDPPLNILLAHGIFRLIGRNNAFPLTLSIIQLAINTLALWYFFLYTQRRFKSPVLHLSFVLFLTFLPVRMIHAVTAGTDWMTVPVFVLVLFLFDKFSSEETSTAKNASFLGLALALGIWSKYSFMALLPPIFVVFAVLWWKRRWNWKRFVTICAFSLVLPTALVLFSYVKSTRVKTDRYVFAREIWIPKGGTPGGPEMTWRDLLLVKAADLELFKAPEMFKRVPEDGNGYHIGFRAAHRHSYLGLSHMSTFTDTQNFFQNFEFPLDINRLQIADFKVRVPWKTPVNVASMSLGALWTLLALLGTPWFVLIAVKNLWRDKLDRKDAAALLGTAYFLLMFLPIPYILLSCLNGYWTPRLILPSLLFFFWAAFLLLDRTIVAKWGKTAFVVLALVLVQCGIEIVLLT